MIALFDQIKSLLQDLVQEGAVLFSDQTYKLTEDELGEYQVPGMQINIANRAISAAPVARLTSGGTGRVDLFRRDRPSETERIFIVRRRNPEGEPPWLIEQKSDEDPLSRFTTKLNLTVGSLINRPQRIYGSLNKQTLENALDYLLRNS